MKVKTARRYTATTKVVEDGVVFVGECWKYGEIMAIRLDSECVWCRLLWIPFGYLKMRISYFLIPVGYVYLVVSLVSKPFGSIDYASTFTPTR